MRSMMVTVNEPAELLVNGVLVIDDHPLFCEALQMTLREVLGVQKVETATCLGRALDHLRAGPPPDAILLDLNLPDVAGLEGLVRLRSCAPGVPVIVVSSMSDARIITSVIQAGAAGFVPKDSARDVFVAAFHAIWQGGTYTPRGYVLPSPAAPLPQTPAEEVLQRLGELTPQQARILDFVCQGMLNKQIAYELSIAETTVKAHITAILRKLGAQSRTQAVRIANQASFAAILRDKNQQG